jgi:hypothetical protein
MLMKSAYHLAEDNETLTTNEARQANGKTSNFRVLLSSLTLAALAGLLLVGYFWLTTPNSMQGVPAGDQTELTVPRDAPVAPLEAKPTTPPPAQDRVPASPAPNPAAPTP